MLGGGRNTGSLKMIQPLMKPDRINNRPMVEYIIEVLDEMEEIERSWW